MTAKPATYSVKVSAFALAQLDEACAYIHAQGAPLAAQRMAARFCPLSKRWNDILIEGGAFQTTSMNS